ncbi:hypothetical protein ACQUY5_23675 [Bacillus cereus]|uniref:hypothetical protein n=1 Tax=Bacillus cereus TaxID=1396 RepID=UPI003D1823CA
MPVYLTVYVVIGAVVCFLTRDKIFLPISEQTGYPIIMFLVLIFFWIPIILVALAIAGRDRLQVKTQKREIDIHTLDRNLDNDARFHFVHSIQGRMYMQFRGSCIACHDVEGLINKTEKFGKKNNPVLQVKMQVCTNCMTKGITGIDVLEEGYREHENSRRM